MVSLSIMYQLLLRFLFKFPAERVHHIAFGFLRTIGIFRPLRQILGFFLFPKNPALHQKLADIHFPSPLGLAAGFDKNAHGVNSWGALGFGFAEMGTITSLPQNGNPTPRLFRLPHNRALFNRMGFNNHGAGAAAAALRTRRNDRYTIPLAGNIGKSKIIENSAAAQDYLESARMIYPFVDFIVINVSSPNTPGLRDLQSTQALAEIIDILRQDSIRLPIFIKIAPDLHNEDILAIAELAIAKNITGIVATNTSINKDILSYPEADDLGSGGISGPPLKQRSLEILNILHRATQNKLILISVGGIETIDDAWERLCAGAHLIEAYTAFIYEGPLWMQRINRGIAKKLHDNGKTHISQIIGSSSLL